MKSPSTQTIRSRWASSVLLTFSMLASISSYANCDFSAPLTTLRRTSPIESSSRKEWSEFNSKKYARAKESAQLIFEQYSIGTWNESSLTECPLVPEDLENLNVAIPNVFFELSLQKLEQVRDLGVETFAKEVRLQSSGNNILPYRMVGHLPGELNPTGKKGGFHRGARSIFMDFEKIPPNEWLIYFSHELFHALDPKLIEGVTAYAKLHDELHALANSGRVYESLSSTELKNIDHWLLAGLDRGYLAEVRAWAATIHLYEALLEESVIPPTPWMENLLKDRLPGETEFSYSLRILDSKFPDPTDGELQSPLLQEALKRLRQKIRTGKTPAQLGALQNFI